MATTVLITHHTDGRIYPGLPQGIIPWYASGTVNGNGSGQMSIDLNFNPPATRAFQPYVSLVHVGIDTQGASMAVEEIEVVIKGNDWEKTVVGPSTSAIIARISIDQTITSNDQAGAFNGGYYCGRVQLGTDGTLTVRGTDTAGSTMNVDLSGFISDRPFVHNKLWSV
jgi:hypothetical protein